MPARYAYSLNGENYTGTFATREQALDAALADARDPLKLEPQSVFIARRVEADPHAAGHARTVLREMAWQAHDEVGAPAANYLQQLRQEQINELDGAIETVLYDWLRKHELLPTFFKAEGISEHPVPPLPSMNGKASDSREVHQVGESLDNP
ncbi:MAG: hypothetical protein JWN40_4371 [Phycisphaerales bacterium]|nr:hypothetical protein [Phycisphaerales bacterium]